MAGAAGFELCELDAVVADDSEICRAAAASALVGARVQAQRVHEVESCQEAVALVRRLQQSETDARRVPVIVFLDMYMPGGLHSAQECCSIYAGGPVLREPFLVCSSAKRLKSSAASYFHCYVGKLFESEGINSVLNACRQWQADGGGEPGLRAVHLAPASRSFLPSLGKWPSMDQLPGVDLSPRSPPVHTLDSGASDEPRRSGSAAAEVKPVGLTDVEGPAPTPAAAVPHTPCAGASDGVLPVGPVHPVSSVPPATQANASESGEKTLDNVSSEATLKPPFDDVQMIGLVGRGHYGRVYKAHWGTTPVALKVVEHPVNDQTSHPTAIFEGALSATLAHPNLVQTFKFSVRPVIAGNQVGGYEVWIMQEWCGLGTLSQKVAQRPHQRMMGTSTEEVVEVACEIASAASYLHSRGIIHGDLEANNVLLTVRQSLRKGYVIKLSDFGLARILPGRKSSINTPFIGTEVYMPPELFKLDGRCLTQKVDIYAFGVILWQLCSGERPFAEIQPAQIGAMVSQGTSLTMPDFVPTPLHDVFTQCTDRAPEQRPAFDRLLLDLKKLHEACRAGFHEDC